MTQAFKFKEYDLEGWETLEAMAAAPRLNQWMYHTIASNLKGDVLEIGSGLGNLSACFLDDQRSLYLSDLRDNYLSYLKDQFRGNHHVLGIGQMDLVHPNFDTIYADKLGRFDGLFALNVVEHIQDDELAIANCKKLLRTGGRLVILVPAYQRLYNGFDKNLEHYRRYNKKSLSRLFQINGLTIHHQQYFNFVGIFGWFFSGSILRKATIPKGQMKVYNTLVPLFRLIDRLVFNTMGLSVIVEGVKD